MSVLRDADTVAISPARGGRGADPAPSEDGTWPAGASFGPYVILEPIGRGGQGTVYRAHDTRLRRQVALKLLGGFSRNSEILVQRFRREAEMASRLEHPGLCSVLDAGVDHGVPYIVMRHVAGMTLAERIARAGVRSEPLDPAGVREVVRLIEQAARALQSAHESGIVHRDIKPGNLMVTPEMGAVVLDFGVARDLAAPEAAFTVAGEIFGTPAYMAPEQLAGSATTPDARCDVYALGVTLYEALTLRRPFIGPDGEGLRHAILHDAPTDPRVVVPAVSRDLKIVIDTALAKDPDARYATAAAFADDLRAVLEARPISARAASVVSRVARWVKREPAKAALTVVLAFGIPLVAALVGFVVARYPDVELARRLRFDQELSGLLQEAFLEVQEGSAPAALVGFETVLARDPQQSEALAGYGLALLRAGRTDDALAFLRGDPRRRGRESLFDRILASGLYELGRYEEARAIDARLGPCRDELECFIAGLIEIARSHGYEPGAAVRAVAHLERAVLLAERPRAISFYALAHAANHARDAGAVRRAAVAIESHWGDAWQSWFWIATSHEWLDADQSLAAYAKTLALKPDFGRALVAMAEVHRHHGRDAEARDHLARALAANPQDPGVHDTAAHIYLDLGDADRAIAARRRSVELYPVSLSYRTAFVRLLRSQGQLAEARKEADALLALDPTRAQSLQMHAEVLFAEGRPDEAVKAAEAGIGASPEDPRILNDCGLVLLDSGRFEAAARAFDRGVVVAPVLEQLHLNRLMLAKATDDHGLALDEHERWVANFPTSPGAREALLTHLVEIDRLEVWRDREALAAAVADALARVGDKDPVLMVAVARAHRVLGDRDAARKAAERAVTLGLGPEQRARLDPILGPATPPK